ncbi:MAG TPA: tetratricopeptide repeat protein [Candidatus Eisenbacteria bacterium]|nr:tetratricopeptide repeat protein [Candidatus Eisenbacteria bacterium]
MAAPALIYLYVCVAAVVTLFAHRTPGYGVETDLLTDFAPAARSLLAGKLDASLYQFHGFGYPLLLALFSLPAGGDLFLAGKILNLLSAGASLWLAYAIFRRYGGKAMGLVVLAGLVTNPSFWVYTMNAGTDMPSLALLLAGTFVALTGGSWATLVLGGCAAGFAYVTRYNALAVILASASVIGWRRRPRELAAYLGGAAIPIVSWLVANAVMTGNPFFNRNYLNVAIAVYGSQTQWDQFTATVGRQFHSMAEVVRYDPVAFARGIGRLLGTHWLHDAKDLLPLWLGIPALAGVLLVWGAKRGWRALALHFALMYLALGFVFYNVRFFLYLLPFYLAGVATLLFPAKPEPGNRVSAWLARLPFYRRPALAGSLACALFLLSGWRVQHDVRLELSREPRDVRLAGDVLRQLGPPNGIVMTRKPHVPFYAGMRQLRFPAEGSLRDLIKEAYRGKANYVLFSGMEASLRPDILVLMDPDVQLPGFHQIDRRLIDGSNYYALYQMDAAPPDSAQLDSAIVTYMRRFGEHHARDSAAHYDIGKELLDMGRAQEALAQLDTALALQPSMVRSQMLEARAYSMLGRYDEARRATLVARQGGAQEAWKESELGSIDFAQGHVAEARKHFEQSLALSPTDLQILGLLEKTQIALGDASGAAATRARIATLSRTTP